MITTLGFDADDTLWHNESFFEEAHAHYAELMAAYGERAEVEAALYQTEINNIPRYGYGIKPFTLSRIETAIRLSGGQVKAATIQAILDHAKAMLDHPVELLPHVADTIPPLAQRFRLILITKGDLHDQQRKIRLSGLAPHFAATEVVAEKNPATYAALFRRHDIDPATFLMVGNSLKSDCLPILELGGAAVHVPYHLTWAHEAVAEMPHYTRFREIASLADLEPLIPEL